MWETISTVILWGIIIWFALSYIDKKFSRLETSLRSGNDEVDGIPKTINDHIDKRLERILELLNQKSESKLLSDDTLDDELYESAVRAVILSQGASAAQLQRSLRIGYARAARLLDMLEETCVIGPADDAGVHQLFIETKQTQKI